MIKAIYITVLFCFLSLCTVQAFTSERETLVKEYREIVEIVNTQGYNKGLPMLNDFEKKDLSKYPDLHSMTLIVVANCHFHMDQHDTVNIILDKAELLIDNYALDSLKSSFYKMKGQTYWKKQDFKTAIDIQLKGLKNAKKYGKIKMEMGMAYDLGCSYAYLMKEDSARHYVLKALDIAYEEDDKVWIANCLGVLSYIEKFAGNLIKAMEYVFETYEVAKIVRGDNAKTRFDYFDNYIHDIYYNLGNLSTTLEITNFNIKHKRSIKFLINIEPLLLIKSSLLLRMDSIESSAAVLAELEQSYQISGNPLYTEHIAAIKGGLMYKKNQLNAAEEELSKLLLKADSVGDQSLFALDPIKKVIFQGLSQLAKIKLQKEDYKKSISICEQQLKNKSIGYHYKKEFYGILAASYKGLGNHGAAYEYLLRRDAVRDKIDRFYEGSLRLSKEQEMLDQQKADEIEKLNYQNELSQVKTVQQRNFLAIGGVLALLVSGLLYLWGRQRKLVFESELVDVKQRLLRQQINPHFIFNVLNSIQNSVLTLKKEKSIELISKFSKLIRQILQNSDKMKVSIHEELSLLTNYMDLEKVRTRNKFDYEVSIDEGVDIHNAEIPSMILQLFVENAIWHGILPKEERGLIKVIIEKEEDRIKVIIDDDGVGRKMSAKLKTKDQQEKISMGMYLVRQRIQTLNKKYQNNIDMFIDDGKNGKGTQVLLIA